MCTALTVQFRNEMQQNNHQLNRVVITGMGALCAIGNTAAETWQALISAKQGADFITLFDTTHSEVKIACEVKGFDPVAHFGGKEARRLDRSVQLAVAATREAVAHSGLVITPENSHDIGVITGTGIGGVKTIEDEQTNLLARGAKRVSPFLVPMMMPNAAAGNISMMFGIRGVNFNVTTACASATNAIGEAFEMLRAGRASAIVCNGNEAPITPLSTSGFNNMTALSKYNDDPAHASRPFDKTRNGFVTGEAGGTLILETLAHARARDAHILAEVIGYSTTADAHHITAPDFNGAVATMTRALAQAGMLPAEIDYICAHGTSTPLNDLSETRAIKIVFGEHAMHPNISSIKSMIGHTLGACGAINALACVNALQTGIIPPTVNYTTQDPECNLNYTPNTAVHRPVKTAMSNSFGFGGHNATLVFKAFVE